MKELTDKLTDEQLIIALLERGYTVEYMPLRLKPKNGEYWMYRGSEVEEIFESRKLIVAVTNMTDEKEQNSESHPRR